MCGASAAKPATMLRHTAASRGDTAAMRPAVVARSWLTPSQVPSGKSGREALGRGHEGEAVPQQELLMGGEEGRAREQAHVHGVDVMAEARAA